MERGRQPGGGALQRARPVRLQRRRLLLLPPRPPALGRYVRRHNNGQCGSALHDHRCDEQPRDGGARVLLLAGAGVFRFVCRQPGGAVRQAIYDREGAADDGR